MTAQDVAIKLVRSYVERGDTIQSLRESVMGTSCHEYAASISGDVLGKHYGPDWIIVTRVNGQETGGVLFKLANIYNQIGGRTTM